MPIPNPIRGIVTPLLTPLRNTNAVDEECFERIIEHVIQGGVSGVFVLGTTGEGPAIAGAPDLVIEILSPSSIETDFLRKSKLYERSGVREYWIVNPEGETVSVQSLDGDRFVIAGEYRREDTLHSSVLEGFELELASIFPKTVDAPNLEKETQPTNDNE